MANVYQKSLKYPDLPNTYLFVQPDGSYDGMTVGNAEQLVATVGVQDKVPYNFRTSGGSNDIGDREVDKVIGGTVAWNQLVVNGNFAEKATWQVSNCSYTVSGNVATATKTVATSAVVQVYQMIPCYENHVYLGSVDVNPSSVCNMALRMGSLYMVASTPASTWTRYARVLQIGGGSKEFNIYGGGELAQNDTIQIRNANLFDLTQMFGSTIADYILSLETATPGAGVAYFRKLFSKPYYAYNAGALMHVQTSGHKMVGFNQWDEQWEVGQYDTTTGAKTTGNNVRSKNLIPVLPNTTYRITSTSTTSALAVPCFYYDANGQFIEYVLNSANATTITPSNAYFMAFYMGAAYGTTYNNDICINLSWSGYRNGEYEPYTERTYPLDSDLVLRGIPKKDASGNLYYDGDTYESDGTVTRRYGIVDFSEKNWAYNGVVSGRKRFSCNTISNMVNNTNFGTQYGVVSGKLEWSPAPIGSPSGYATDKCFTFYSGAMYVNYDASEDPADLKAYLNGVYMVYELATPTTETADPYANPQWVNDFGTEEYIDSRDVPIPVGHDTFYRANLRDKLQHLPEPAESNGTYAIQQTDEQMALVPMPAVLPTLPTEDGTYSLKITVSGSTKTLSWEADA